MKQTAMPKVLFLGDHFGYASGVVHGSTTYNLTVVPAVVAAGVDVTACFLRGPHPAAQAFHDAGIETLFLAAHPLDPLVVPKVATIARQRGCRVIHSAGIKGTLVARIVAPRVGAGTIVHVHDENMPRGPIKLLHRAFSRPTDIGMCVSASAQQVAIDGYAIRPDRARVLHNATDLEKFRAALESRAAWRLEIGVSETAPVIALIGRMYPVKGHKGMLEIMAEVVRRCPDAVLLVIGDGPERADCEALAARLEIGSQVRFLGQRLDVPELLAATDVVAIPSLSEGLPIAAIEAQAAGKPVVAYRVGGLPEVVNDGSDGMLIAPGEQSAFARALVQLLADPGLRDAYGRAAAVSVERFGVARHVEALLDLYREAAPAEQPK
jgi:L-malate glycosyltransferase